jgi:inhibitor of KinA
MDRTLRFFPAGDQGILVELGDTIDPDIHRRVRGLFHLLEENPVEGIREVVPAYRSILIFYDPLLISPEEVKRHLAHLHQSAEDQLPPTPRTVDIPVVYGGVFGPDLTFVAQYHHLEPEEVIRIHTAGEYLVYLVGFSPGFPFMGGLDSRIHTPRLETPRTRVPRGSVAIANQQTGIYPVESPGGWRIIGRTPVQLYRPRENPPVLVRMGDRVRFRPISPAVYQRFLKEEED